MCSLKVNCPMKEAILWMIKTQLVNCLPRALIGFRETWSWNSRITGGGQSTTFHNMTIMPVCPHCIQGHPVLAPNATLHCFSYLPVPEGKGFLSFMFEFLETTAGYRHSEDAINSLICWMTEWINEWWSEGLNQVMGRELHANDGWARAKYLLNKTNSFLLFGPRLQRPSSPMHCPYTYMGPKSRWSQTEK